MLHYTAMACFEDALQRLCDPDYEVSAHYLIAQDGAVTQMVAEDMRAWHAGAGSWAGCDDVNSASVGIELCNRGDHPFPQLQIDALTRLLCGITQRWNIPGTRIIGHSDMAPGRKVDPGPLFPWAAFTDLGVPVWPSACVDPVPTETFQKACRTFGYTADVDEDTLLQAVRLRFLPGKSGPLDEEDRALAHYLSNLIDPIAPTP